MKLISILILSILLPALVAAQTGIRIELITGNAALARPDGSPWPLEKGQRLLQGDRLILGEGSSVRLLFLRRIRIRVDGPGELILEALVEAQEDETVIPSVLLNSTARWTGFDTRYQFERAMEMKLKHHGGVLSIPSGVRWLLGLDSKGKETHAVVEGQQFMEAQRVKDTLVADEKSNAVKSEKIPSELRRWLDQPQSVLVLTRDYDQDTGRWPKSAVLGPILVRELGSSYPRYITLVDGSGTTALGRTANNAIKTADDVWLRKLGLEAGADWVLVGNLVVRDPDKERSGAAHYDPPVYKARAEARLIESHPGGDILVSEAATTTVARVGRPRQESQQLALQGAAAELASHLHYHFGELVQGRSHPAQILSFAFSNVTASNLDELKKGLGGLEGVQRLFSRRFTNGVYKADIVPRKSERELLEGVSRIKVMGLSLEKEGTDSSGALLFRLQ